MSKPIPLYTNTTANADDFSINSQVNSTAITVNTHLFKEAAGAPYNQIITTNISGMHVSFMQRKPITNFPWHDYLDDNGNKNKVNKKSKLFSPSSGPVFFEEINTQIIKALSQFAHKPS